jgi:diacylglycerol kinase (ATP)
VLGKIDKIMKRCVILNPKAGSVRDVDTLLNELAKLDTTAIHVTAEAGAAENFARAAVRDRCDEIIVAGGDGTLNEVVNGIGEDAAHVRLGLLPLGTGNDFARSFNFPATLAENLEIVRTGHTTSVDLVRVRSDSNRYFINVSAGGFSGLVDEKLTAEVKRTWGPLSYIRCAAAAFPELRAYRTAVKFDDDETINLALYNLIVANGRYVAGGLPIAPEADPRDGLLDVVLISARPTSEIVMLAAQILLGKHTSHEAVTVRRARSVSVNSKPGMWFNVDGELVGNEPVTFEIMARALQVIVPAAS